MSADDGRLLGLLYDCPAQPARWSTLLDAVSDRLGVRSAVIQVLSRSGDRLRETWCVRDSLSLAERDRHDALVNNPDNPRLNLRLSRRPRPTGIVRDEERFAPGCPHHRELKGRLAQIGLGAFIGVSSEFDPEASVDLVLHRAVGDSRCFSAEDEKLLFDLSPHIRRAVRLANDMEQARRQTFVLHEVIDEIRQAIVLCDRHGHVRWMNKAARDLLARSDRLRVVQGRLCAADRTAAASLAELIAHADNPGRRARVGDASDPEALHLRVAAVDRGPSAGWAVPPDVVAVLISQPGARPQGSEALIADMFGLSPAEAGLTLSLCSGLSVADHARNRGVTVGTARIQLKRAMAKTETRRQSELVRRVSACLADGLPGA
ncbi:helix-turn-helix transcriptional regulator [Phenylobacterium sp.]|jgi:DNA-binding CsgD family transcriptional regulator/PAS domain-containing protein|uniref:helix-turn-helix transcriptional regulator n=1 Tax=Phenylobacterium sp. TaxID=1871053 RepID=UPI00378449A0